MTPEEQYVAAVEAASVARKAFSEAFMRYKVARDGFAKTGVTDGEATHRAYLDHGPDRDRAEALVEVARIALARQTNSI